jgi:uncharacterized protein (UPF0261 family)
MPILAATAWTLVAGVLVLPQLARAATLDAVTVASAQELQYAVRAGVPYIKVVDHLDMTQLPADAGTALLDVSPNVKSIQASCLQRREIGSHKVVKAF